MYYKYLLQMVKKCHLSFSSVLHAKLIRNLCNTMLVHEKNKDTPSSHNHACSLLFVVRKKQTNTTRTTTKHTQISFLSQSEKWGRKFHRIKTPSHEIRGDLSPSPQEHTVRTEIFSTRPQGIELNQLVADKKQQL